ncbi:MAG: undecaprenyl-diphosphate phosphatase [Acidobacteriota bacterium]
MANEVVQAIILGILQGLTEFLPISSSAHLLLVPWLFGWESFGILFDVILHGGTLAAILLYFRSDWSAILRGALARLRSPQGKEVGGPEVGILLGTIPAIVVALVFRSWIEDFARVPAVTAVTLTVFGVLLWWADRRRGERGLGELTWQDALWIGVAQSLALVPGVSRSGITITAALWLGYRRDEAARFSFLLGGPIMFLGFGDALWEWIQAPGNGVAAAPLAAGFATSFVVGFLCIKYFLDHLKRHGFMPFVLYRLALAGVIAVILLGWHP